MRFRLDLMTGGSKEVRKLLNRNVLCAFFVLVFGVVSCAHGKPQVEQPTVPPPEQTHEPTHEPSITVLQQTIERLETVLSEREDQITTLRQRLERVTEQRDAYVAELEQTNRELDKLKEENEKLSKKIEEILAPKPDLPPAKPDIYEVQAGDTLESIAAKADIYGDRSRWKEIFEENKDVIGSAPDELVPGTKLIIPRP